MILILSDRNDQHADRVEIILKNNDAEYSRLNLDVDSVKSTQIKIENNTYRIEAPNCTFSSCQIDAVWNRSALAKQFIRNNNAPDGSDLILKENWSKGLEGLFSSLESTKWLNFYQDFYGMNQTSQFTLSKNIGLKWPSLICTNDINYLNSFFEYKKERVLELMKQGCLNESCNNCAGKCSERMGQSMLEDFPSFKCPVSKTKYIVRCSVVGKEYFVGKIRAKVNESSELSEIQSASDLEIFPPNAIKRIAIQLMTELNLTHGVFDFMVTETDDWYFDSLNPVGQYQWIENIKNKDISSSIAKWLMMNN